VTLLGWISVFLVYVVPIVVCLLKRKWHWAAVSALTLAVTLAVILADAPGWLFFGSVLIGLFSAGWAFEMAHPRSWWARHFYDPGELRRAEARFYGWPEGPTGRR
jgi:ABC-type microcin C transport system permease subunit YejB